MENPPRTLPLFLASRGFFRAFSWILACGFLVSCGKPPKYVEITSDRPGTKVYFNGKPMGTAPIRFTEKELKERGLTFPYDIRNGPHLWNAWDIDQKSGDAITVQNSPEEKVVGRFTFEADANSQYRTTKADGVSWYVIQLTSQRIGNFPDQVEGWRFIAVPVKFE